MDSTLRLERARLLARAGLGYGAWTEAKRILELAPVSSAEASTAREVFFFSPFGTAFGHRWPRSEAINAYTRALEASPDDTLTQSYLVTAYLHTTEPLSTDEIDAVLPPLRTLVRTAEQPQARLKLLHLQLHSARYDELLAETEGLTLTPDILAARLAAAVGTDELDRVFEDATARAPQVRSEGVKAGAGELLRLGRSADAARLLRAGADRGVLPERSRGLLAALERIPTAPPIDGPLDPTDPLAVTQRFVDLLYSADPEAVAEQLAEAVSNPPSAERRERWTGFARLAVSRFSLGGTLPAPTVREMFRASMTLESEAAPGVGWKTTFRSVMDPDLAMDIYLAVPDEPGEPLRWVAWDNGGDWPASRLGREALHRLDGPGTKAERTAAARRWLEWERTRPYGDEDSELAGEPWTDESLRRRATTLVDRVKPALPIPSDASISSDAQNPSARPASAPPSIDPSSLTEPSDPATLRADLESRLGDPETGPEAAFRLAWLDLVERRVTADTLERARRAVRSDLDHPTYLLALASTHAALGNTEEALSNLHELISQRSGFHGAAWTVLGLLAESYGETELAHEAYLQGGLDLAMAGAYEGGEPALFTVPRLLSSQADALEAESPFVPADGPRVLVPLP